MPNRISRALVRGGAFALLAALSLACSLFESTESPAPVVAPTPPVTTAPEAAPSAPAEPPSQAFDPRAIGTRVLANYQRAGFAYAAVVTGTFGDDTVNVVYADGDSERLPPSELYPEVLAPGTRVEARIRQWDRFFPGRIARRVAHAVFVEFDDGDQQWTSIGFVRVPVASLSRDAAAAIGNEPSGAPPAAGSAVLANYQRAGWFYPAILAESRDDGQVHVIYADGDSEWLAPSDVRPDTLESGTAVEARPRDGVVRQGAIARRVGHATELLLPDGEKLWVALANVRVR